MDQHKFQVTAPFAPTGDQPQAIESLLQRLSSGERFACLLGATGTGKTFTMAHTIARLNKPTLIISHNKTLAAQLFEELREFFPENSVNYFVSYYDYYQPEAYIPQRDIYIEKDSSRNDDLDLLRLAATSNLLSRRDTVVVASVSCIFGLGSPEAYGQKVLTITRGSRIERREFFLALQAMQYNRTEIEWKRALYRARGDAIEVWPSYERFAVRIELFGDEIEKISLVNPTSGEVLAEERQFFLFPAVHYVMPEDRLATIIEGIRGELDARVMELRSQGKLLEAQRLLARTKYDLEMIEEVGFCNGIENYSRWMDGRAPGERPYTLMDYFDYAPSAEPDQTWQSSRVADLQTDRAAAGRHDAPAPPAAHSVTLPPDECATSTMSPTPANTGNRRNLKDWLLIIDESHVTLPQIHAMFNGDQNRKRVLVDHGFRLPSALDNRPLRFEEFESIVPRMLFVSATPGPYELAKCGGVVAEQVIRPTGLIDPEIEVRPASGQVADLIERSKERVATGERVLVTALTKRLCEDLTRYLDEQGLRVRYLHSEIDTLDRVGILQDLRRGEFDVLVGVNLLREGLDLPEVSLVCILDADKEGFLRSGTSLIQQMGRAARNVNARVVMYADKMTPAMQAAIEETERRRTKQIAYNQAHGITPTTIKKAIREGIDLELKARRTAREAVGLTEDAFEVDQLTATIEAEMYDAAQSMDFERAAILRDQLQKLKSGALGSGKVRRSEVEKAAAKGGRGGSRAGAKASSGPPGSPGSKSGKKRKRAT